MWARWVSTVRTERNSCSPISAFVWPSAMSRRTSASRSERLPGGPAACSGVVASRAPSAGFRYVPPRRRGGGLDELGVGGLLQDVAERARAERAAGVLRVLLHREDDGLGLRGALGDTRQRLQRRLLAGHVEVEHEHVGLWPEDGSQRPVDVRRLGDDLEAGVLVQQQPQARSDDRVIVGQDDGDRRHPASLTPPRTSSVGSQPGVRSAHRRIPHRR